MTTPNDRNYIVAFEHFHKIRCKLCFALSAISTDTNENLID